MSSRNVLNLYNEKGLHNIACLVYWRCLEPACPGNMFSQILRQMPGVEIVEQNIQVDHIHTIMIIPPKYSVSEVIERIKCKSASRLRKKFKWPKNVFGKNT